MFNLSNQLSRIGSLALGTAIFGFDVLTPPENVAICLAYSVPIFLSYFDTTPRPLLYASIATALSVVGWLLQPRASIGTALVVTNLLIAIAVQWLVAVLVRLQRQRYVDALEKAEGQRRLVNVLSHEVGTALTIVAGQASRIMKLSGQIEPDDVRQRAKKIRDAGNRIESIVDRIRFASSFGDGSIQIERCPVNLKFLLRQLGDQLADENPDRTIEIELCNDEQIIDGDEVLIRQALENVILNGIKYSLAQSNVHVDIASRGNLARITVVDRGTGISEFDLTRIRAPYYRGANSKGISGTGIGLYVVEQIVKAHKGLFAIDSALGVGTKVTLDFPKQIESLRR